MLEKIRQYFIFGDSAAKLYGLAIVTGLLASLIIIAFRLFIDYGQIWLFPTGEIEGFANLPWQWVLGLPIAGGLLIGLLLYGLKPEQRNTGVVHVIERLSSYEGRLPWQNALRQFFGAGIALISGHSIGREGPSVHLGAAGGSQLASLLDLPNNSVRILVACGTAAAIAASFNTPIAGVIFAMEVIMMEYHIASFIPIILASVTGTVLSRLTFGETAIFANLSADMQSLWEIPYIVLMGVLIGGLATLFVRSLGFFSGLFNNHPYWLRTTYAGILMGLAGLMVPEVMGMSYNAISGISSNEAVLSALLILMVLKLGLSTACVGLGIPGGLIGPTLVVGACAGAALGIVGGKVFPELSSTMTFYAVIGMCAMMGATLKAPLAALMAMLELTANPNIILPGMLAIVFSSLVIHDYFKEDALFMKLLRARGLDFRNDPVTQTLRRLSVANAMQRNFIIMSREVSTQAAVHALESNPDWVLIKEDREPVALMPAGDLARAVSTEEGGHIDLMQIPASRRNVHKISLHASLHEAAESLNSHHVEALFVTRMTAPMIERTYGILTRETIESHYRLPSAVTAKHQ
ncbi:chloride channel protein [uncultured Methylophaga sp.]|uniref:chloride channel protein n=1 Tax=uncultured Methylophaga sp. TaxID=285271 RepID=UPI002613796E|nr:chloride channel protein [uncultured Methylophaga sp.]